MQKILLAAAAAALAGFATGTAPPDMTKTFNEICQENGFAVEQHSVTTTDGYVLGIFRIPGDIGEEANTGKPVIIFQHGLLDSSDSWIMNTAENAPAFVASRAGYDVWLTNSRGNKYSRENTHISPDDFDFWEFSFVEMGDLDMPAYFEYILDKTGQDNVAYVGHSQGTSQMFYALSHNEIYFKDKVSVFLALAPVIHLDDPSSWGFESLIESASLINDAMWSLGLGEIFPPSWVNSTMVEVCGSVPSLCELGDGIIADNKPDEGNQVRAQVYLGHYPAGASW